MFYICLSLLRMNENPHTTFPEGVFMFSHIVWVLEQKIPFLLKGPASGQIVGKGGKFFWHSSLSATDSYD